tara:strand:+ start:47 stop:364 length:318 start_codon:yes stop_codon:yes gene_type:complete
MHLYKEAKSIVSEAIEQVGTDRDELQQFIHESCDCHEVAIYYGKAIEFCATQDTNDGEQWLEDCGSLVQAGDTFGGISCRIAFATLYCACERVLEETLEDMESDE